MSFPRRVLARWIPLAALASALTIVVYLAAQQTGRQLANDPQIQVARDVRDALNAGGSVQSVMPPNGLELTRSLAPWMTVLDSSGKVIASSATLNGQSASLPSGVIDNVRVDGEERVTWQPQPGVRMATVTMRTTNTPLRFVTVGRSLSETEQRIAQFRNLLFLCWIATLLGLLAIVAAVEAAFK